MTEVRISANDGGQFGGYLARPASGSGPGLLVIQEIFGVNAVMRGLCDGFATQGYVALCPDLFWRQQPGIQITDQTEAEWQQAFALYKGFDVDKGIDDLKASLAWLRGQTGVTGKVGTVGFCLGGKLAYLMATRSDADANVSYYGVGIENDLGEATGISRPILLHIAEKDGYVPPAAQDQIIGALKDHPKATLHRYAGCDHAFARVGGQHYDAAAAQLAAKRTADFFAAHLR